VELIINDEGFFYEAQQIILLFFHEHSDIKVTCTVFDEGDFCVCKSSVKNGEKEGVHEEAAKVTIRRDKADCIKKSLYFACRKISDTALPWGILTGIRPAKPYRAMLESGAGEEETKKYFKEHYFVDDEKINLAESIAKTEARLISRDKNEVSVYVGIPFCPTRCSYCSFISYDAGKMIKLSAEYTSLLMSEMDKTAQVVKELGMKVRCLYFGGGTPTALSEAELSKVLSKAERLFCGDNLLEFTVEAGRPDTINHEKLDIIKGVGAKRISINPQTASDKTLEIIERRHTYAEFERAFDLAREKGFENVNCDLIAGLPEEKCEDFETSLQKIMALSPENITVHTLYMKRASTLSKQGFLPCSEEEITKMVSLAQNILPKGGYKPYYLYKQKATLGNLENVGFSKKGYECIYNIDTMSDESTVLALGAGGATKIVLGDRIERIFNFKNADEYIRRFEEIIERKESIKKYYK